MCVWLQPVQKHTRMVYVCVWPWQEYSFILWEQQGTWPTNQNTQRSSDVFLIITYHSIRNSTGRSVSLLSREEKDIGWTWISLSKKLYKTIFRSKSIESTLRLDIFKRGKITLCFGTCCLYSLQCRSIRLYVVHLLLPPVNQVGYDARKIVFFKKLKEKENSKNFVGNTHVNKYN